VVDIPPMSPDIIAITFARHKWLRSADSLTEAARGGRKQGVAGMMAPMGCIGLFNVLYRSCGRYTQQRGTVDDETVHRVWARTQTSRQAGIRE
jgi:hypothetical protein